MPIELRAGQARALLLLEHGGRLHELFLPAGAGEEQVLHAPPAPAAYRDRPTRGGSFPMAPWPNRVDRGRFRWQGREFALPLDGKPHASHGRVLGVPWRVDDVASDACELSAPFGDGWPWRGFARQRFQITASSLAMTLELHALDEPFPAGGGWHPWFRRDAAGAGDVRVTLPAHNRWVIADGIPTGELVAPAGDHDFRQGPPLAKRRVDACYTGLTGPVRIRWPGLELLMTIECEQPHIMLYTPAEAFCVEPQTCAPDAFNLADRGIAGTGIAVSERGRPVLLHSRWSWSIT